MPQITLNATAAQSARIQEAVGIHNALTGQSLTVKQWIYRTLRSEVVALIANNLAEQNDATEATASATVQSDMSGGG